MVTNFHKDNGKKVEKATALLTLAAVEGKVRGTCLNDEEMAGLIDGRYGAIEMSEFWEHLGSCNECYEQWLFLKKIIRQDAPGGRLYHLSWLRKYRYIGTALAAAASIAVYLNVVKIEDKVVEHAEVPQTIIMQDQNTTFQSPMPVTLKEKKNEPARMKEQAPEVLPAAPSSAPMAVGSGPAKDRLAGQPVPRQSAQKPLEELQKSASTAPMNAARDAEGASVRGAALPLVESALAPVAAPPMEDVGGWLEQLHTACLSGRDEAPFWNDLAARGLRLQAIKTGPPGSAAEKKMVTVLALVQEISGPDAVSPQCRLILAELAKESGNK